MPLLAFLLEAVFISLSGVLAPGPMTAMAVGKGSDSPHAGALLAVGHGIVEFPLMVAILYGFGVLLNRDGVRVGIALVGGLFLLVMAIAMLEDQRLRLHAVHALGDIGDTGAVAPLISFLDTPGLGAYGYDALRRMAARSVAGAQAACDRYTGPRPQGPISPP